MFAGYVAALAIAETIRIAVVSATCPALDLGVSGQQVRILATGYR